jgi:hypothetical protein
MNSSTFKVRMCSLILPKGLNDIPARYNSLANACQMGLYILSACLKQQASYRNFYDSYSSLAFGTLLSSMRLVSAIECISADGRYLNPMIIWPASTHRANWTTHPTPGWHYAHSESGYTDSKISLEWLKRVFDPQTKERANKKPRILICDGFGTHETLEILEFVLENNIVLCRLPSHTSHKLQPCDIAVFAPLKAAYRDQVERLERGGVGTVGKQHFTYLYSPARERAFHQRNILAGWKASGLYPFNPDKVIMDIPKPVIEPTIPILQTCEINLNPQGEVLHTPVTADGLTSLHNLIKEDVCVENGMTKQRLQNHIHKLAS